MLAAFLFIASISGCQALPKPEPGSVFESRQAQWKNRGKPDKQEGESKTSKQESESKAGKQGIEPKAEKKAEDKTEKELSDQSALENGHKVEKGDFPSRYDARTDGRTAPVKNQGDLGTCWAFASLLALESSLLPGESYDFSEDHMSHDPYFLLDQKSGGDYIMSMAYLLSWRGPVLEEEDPYGDGISPEGLKAVCHVQEIQILPEYDRDAIKEAVYRTGGVQSALYTTLQGQTQDSRYYKKENGAYYYSGTQQPNHDVVIVGWDDDYPAENFTTLPPENGAFLCENSWGTGFGKDGFFYVSYYDTNLGATNLVYSGVEPTDNYDEIYQSDLCGWLGQIGYGGETIWAANVYQATASEQESQESGNAQKDSKSGNGQKKQTAGKTQKVQAAGFYAVGQNTEYEISILKNVPEHPSDADWRALKRQKLGTTNGSVSYAGYYTIPLAEPVELEPGERFAVLVELKTPGAVHPMAIEYDSQDGRCRVDLTDGEGYISADGDLWESAEEQQDCNLCLKAYTAWE